MKQKLIQLEQDGKEFFACGSCGGQGINPMEVKHLDSCPRNGYTSEDFMVDRNEWGTFIVCVNCGAHAKKGVPVKHYDSCKPGEAGLWAEWYDQNPEPEIDLEMGEGLVEALTTDDKAPFITVYKAIAGWKAQVVMWNEEEEFWEPWQTSHYGYENPLEAEKVAKDWARDEDLKYVIPKDPKFKEEIQKYKEEHPNEV